LQPLLQLSQFTCLRDDTPVFTPVHMTVEPKDVWQVAGPNGAGKTTLLRAICGLFDHIQGECLWLGQSVAKQQLERNAELLYLGHHPGVKGALTAFENLAWAMKVAGGGADDDAFSHALAQVGLAGYEHTLCHQMSAGQQRRVALARLYLSKAKLWVLDEPFTAIDVQGVVRLEQLISAHAADGGSVVMTSHQPIRCDGLNTLKLRPHVSPHGVESLEGGDV